MASLQAQTGQDFEVWLAESRREMADSRWQWVGLCILKRKRYRLVLAYFDFIQTLRGGRDRRMQKNSR